MCAAHSTLSPPCAAGLARITISRKLAQPIEPLECRRLLSSAYTLQTLATFNEGNGSNPQGGLITDSSGDLYGTTTGGGLTSAGTVFEVVAGSGTPTTLATFDGLNGSSPQGTLVTDSSGDLFGTTADAIGFSADGTVYEVAAGSGAASTLVTFNGSDGSTPTAGLIIDSSGDVFGTTSQGGSSSDGTVFAVVAGSGSVTTLATFTGSNGQSPQGSLVTDSSGDVFGTTSSGGSDSDGTVFEVVAGSGAASTLATFNGSNGAFPDAGLVMDSNGNLFGTTSSGGADNDGTVFEVPAGSGIAITLATFTGANGSDPVSGLLEDSSGDLFGTTKTGGTGNDGTVFEVAAGSGTVTDLLNFNGTNGAQPYGELITDSNGDLFGTTSSGGGSDDGTVFELVRSAVVPPVAPATVEATANLPGSIKITWSGVSNASYYRLFRSTTDNATDATVLASGIAAKKYTDSSPTLVSDHDFYYFVEAVNPAGHSHLSAVAIGRAAPLPLTIALSQANTAVATGSPSPSTGDAVLSTTAAITNNLNLWFAVAATTTANATSSVASAHGSDAFAKRGLIQPGASVTFADTFTEPGDQASVGLTMSHAAGILNILDLVLPASVWTISSNLIPELDNIYNDTSLGSAVQSLIKGSFATTTSQIATDAKAIANDAAALFANNDKQLHVVNVDLKAIGVGLTSSEQTRLDTPAKIESLSKDLIAVAQSDTQLKSGNPTSVDFTAESN
jgi:uncharacterized repeat protein (TIGR03803 family)